MATNTDQGLFGGQPLHAEFVAGMLDLSGLTRFKFHFMHVPFLTIWHDGWPFLSEGDFPLFGLESFLSGLLFLSGERGLESLPGNLESQESQEFQEFH